MKVLIAEDDADLLDVTTYALQRAGFQVVGAVDGQQVLHRVEVEHPDIVLLDINLPKLSGFDVCHRIRQDHDTGIIMLTARLDEKDIVRAFDLGADDYVCKPFSVQQLIARMKAVLRRIRNDWISQPEGGVQVGDLHLDQRAHRVTKDGVRVQLTPLEFRILHMLVMNQGLVIPYSRLIEYAWGYDGGDSNLLKTHIYHLRRKLRISAKQADGIQAVSRVGYTFGRN
jgi:DNA-binding response OmpR family regulator